LKLRYNKKGSSLDNIFVAISFFGLVIFLIVINIFWTAVETDADDLWTGSSIGTNIRESGSNLVDNLDFMGVLLWMAMHIGVILMSYMLRSHPVIYVAGIFIMIILVLIAAPLSNAYDDMGNDADLSEGISALPMCSFIMDHLPKLELIWAFATAIALFAFAQSEGFI